MTTEYKVVGPPGTGKTTYVVGKLRDAVRLVGPDAVCVASFTRAAATEIAGRVRTEGGIIPAHHIGTLHSFALRQMDGQKLIYGMPDALASWNEYGQWPLSSLEGDADTEIDAPAQETAGDRYLAEMEQLRARMVPREAWPSHVRAFADQWEGWKLENLACDFTDLLEAALSYIETAPGDPSFFFLDEAQDLSRLEMALARKWAAQTDTFVVVGDADQALYRWRGADPEVFAEGEIDRVLSQSFRVPRAVHAEATSWIERLPGRPPVAYEPRDYEGEVVKRPAWNWRFPEPLIEDACRRMDEGQSVMILASCDYMLRPLLAALRKSGVPYHNPYRRKNGAWNPLGAKHGAKDRLLAFLRFDPEVWGEEARNWNAVDLHEWIDLCEARGLLRRGAKQGIAERAAHMDALREIPRVELERWFEDGVIEDIEAHAFQPDSLDWLASHLLGSKSKALEFPLAVARRRGAAELRRKPELIVGTVHSVKGGQADAVYLYPDLSPQALRGWAAGRPAERADVRRMFYVGMTRARETLVLCGAHKSFTGVTWDA